MVFSTFHEKTWFFIFSGKNRKNHQPCSTVHLFSAGPCVFVLYRALSFVTVRAVGSLSTSDPVHVSGEGRPDLLVEVLLVKRDVNVVCVCAVCMCVQMYSPRRIELKRVLFCMELVDRSSVWRSTSALVKSVHLVCMC